MKTASIIEGLTILEKYRDKPDGYNCSAEHDVLYAHATDRPLELADLEKMVMLGWNQVGCNSFGAQDYRPDESWYCYT